MVKLPGKNLVERGLYSSFRPWCSKKINGTLLSFADHFWLIAKSILCGYAKLLYDRKSECQIPLPIQGMYLRCSHGAAR
jgi:hypothetical protein